MVIDSLTATDVYVEKREIAKIIGNKTTNNKGILEIDNYGNELISVIDSGDTPLYRLSKYSGTDGLLLYDPTTKNMQIANSGDLLKVNVDFERGTKYYIGAKLMKSNVRTNNVFTVELGELIPLKVFMDGREITSYSSNQNSITISGTDRLLIDTFSEIVVYAYKTTNITDSTEFEIEYYQYQNIWDKELFFSEVYFQETMKLEPIQCFESLSINQNVTKTVYRGGFRKSSKTKVNSVDNTADFDIFDASELVDMVQWVGRSEFRIVLINNQFGRCVILNNCRVNNGVSLIFDKSKNSKKFTLSCGNYIDIKVGEPSVYGEGRYGKGLYGTNTYIYNSHKVGD